MNPETKALIDPAVFQVIIILFGLLITVLGTMITINVNRVLERQNAFSKAKDDHENRLTKLEEGHKNHTANTDATEEHFNKNLDRVEYGVNEVRGDVKNLTNMVVEYLLKAKK